MTFLKYAVRAFALIGVVCLANTSYATQSSKNPEVQLSELVSASYQGSTNAMKQVGELLEQHPTFIQKPWPAFSKVGEKEKKKTVSTTTTKESVPDEVTSLIESGLEGDEVNVKKMLGSLQKQFGDAPDDILKDGWLSSYPKQLLLSFTTFLMPAPKTLEAQKESFRLRLAKIQELYQKDSDPDHIDTLRELFCHQYNLLVTDVESCKQMFGFMSNAALSGNPQVIKNFIRTLSWAEFSNKNFKTGVEPYWLFRLAFAPESKKFYPEANWAIQKLLWEKYKDNAEVSYNIILTASECGYVPYMLEWAKFHAGLSSVLQKFSELDSHRNSQFASQLFKKIKGLETKHAKNPAYTWLRYKRQRNGWGIEQSNEKALESFKKTFGLVSKMSGYSEELGYDVEFYDLSFQNIANELSDWAEKTGDKAYLKPHQLALKWKDEKLYKVAYEILQQGLKWPQYKETAEYHMNNWLLKAYKPAQ